MIHYDDLFEKLEKTHLISWVPELRRKLDDALYHSNNGNLPRWLDALANLPDIHSIHSNLNANHVSVGCAADINADQQQCVYTQLRELMPWRKGPYKLFDITIDTEWHSDWKWERLAPHIASLEEKMVLDVGCGNGYHSWRIAGAGAKLVLGIDPSLLFVMQYQAIKKYAGDKSVYVVPLRLEDMPLNTPCFDSVFSMGVLYHRKSPFDHLAHLYSLLKPGGQLVLETLVIRGEENNVLVPHERYAKMNNVWFLPSPPELKKWLTRTGFEDVKLVDLNQTSIEEQRVTEWMSFESLADFLDPTDHNLTIEGYPAPLRAIFICQKP